MATYSEKLKDPRWQKKRLEIMDRDNFICQLCGDSETTLNVHHKRYLKNTQVFEYENDDVTTGQMEYWMFPFELRAMKKGDCDDWANELASYLIGANVPEFRVRVVCGETRTGGGHSTVYVLDDSLSTWRHLNSTTPYAAIHGLDLKDMPTSKDTNDGIGIGQVWFSYNNQFAWHQFEGGARISYNKDKRSSIISGIM